MWVNLIRLTLGACAALVVLFPSAASAELTPASSLGIGFAEAYAIESADFNRDGLADLAVSRERSVEIYDGEAGEVFAPARSFATAEGPRRITIADLDRDGFEDVITANFFADSVSILYGRGDGTFKRRENIKVGDGPVEVAVGHVDEDRRLDLAVTNGLSDDVRVLIARKRDGFKRLKPIRSRNAPQGILLLDLDGNRIKDLVHTSASRLIVRLGRGDGSFRRDRQIRIEYGLSHLAASDLNGDGETDIAVSPAQNAEQRTHILLGRGNGRFEPPVGYVFLDSFIQGLALADLTGDGIEDIVVTTAGNPGGGGLPGHLWLRPGVGDGSFGESTGFEFDGRGGPFALGDFDESGTTDVAAVYEGSEFVAQLYLNEP